MSDLLKRKGKIRVSRTLIDEDAELVLEALKDILITDVLYHYMKYELTYWGYSKRFEIVEEHIEIPEYLVSIKEIDGEKIVEFKR
jgi:hypothetical protein